jgi:uncharacterized protein YecE (DUF72 family)
VPGNFFFSVKMSKFITRIKRLDLDSQKRYRFTESVHHVKEKLRVVLVQLPPGLKFDYALMRDFVNLLDKDCVEAKNFFSGFELFQSLHYHPN